MAQGFLHALMLQWPELVTRHTLLQGSLRNTKEPMKQLVVPKQLDMVYHKCHWGDTFKEMISKERLFVCIHSADSFQGPQTKTRTSVWWIYPPVPPPVWPKHTKVHYMRCDSSHLKKQIINSSHAVGLAEDLKSTKAQTGCLAVCAKGMGMAKTTLYSSSDGSLP